MDKYSYISNADINFIDNLYQTYQQDPSSLDNSWQKFFQGFDFGKESHHENGKSLIQQDPKEIQVRNLIYAHRSRAHLKSDTNPVRDRRRHTTRLKLDDFGISESDFQMEVEVGAEIGLGKTSIKSIIDRLAQIYLGHLGYEYNHIRNSDIFEWFKKKVEREGVIINPPKEEKTRILSKLTESVVFENFLQ